MARVNVYLPDDLAAAARTAGLNVSAVTQRALREQLAARSTEAWLAVLRPGWSQSTQRPTHEAVMGALDAARDEAPTRHA